MSEKRITYSPVRDQWVLSDGRHWMEVPGWARDIVRDEAERETRQLRERITTQKQTIQAYRDESREWREVAERAQAENAKLRELVRYIMHQCNDGNPRCDECIGWNDGECVALLRMRELEVDA